MSGEREVVFGVRAGLAVLERRPLDVLEVVYADGVAGELDEGIRQATAQRIAVRPAPEARLRELSGSTHHEGLCVVTRPRPWQSAKELGARLAAAPERVVALDRVRNPYNIGAILRTAAYFGIEHVLLGALAPQSALPADAVRVAEGGAEWLRLCRTTDLAATLARLRGEGVTILGAESDGSLDVQALPRPGALVVVVGHEREGLSPRVRAQCDHVIAIRGGGAVGSLNVAVAAGILLASVAAARG